MTFFLTLGFTSPKTRGTAAFYYWYHIHITTIYLSAFSVPDPVHTLLQRLSHFQGLQIWEVTDLKWYLNPGLISLRLAVLKVRSRNPLQGVPQTPFHGSARPKELSVKVIKVLLPFPTIFLCEAGFSRQTSTRTMYRNSLNAEADENPVVFFLLNQTLRRFIKYVKQCYSSHSIVWFGKTGLFFIKICHLC